MTVRSSFAAATPAASPLPPPCCWAPAPPPARRPPAPMGATTSMTATSQTALPTPVQVPAATASPGNRRRRPDHL